MASHLSDAVDAVHGAWDENRFLSGFGKSFGVILASEIGDKTFFIAAIMAMTSPRLTVFMGAISALAAMTVLSALLGYAAPSLISPVYTHYATVILFFFFGIKILYDVFFGEDDGEASELHQVEEEINESRSPLINKGGEDGKLKKYRNIIVSVASIFFSQVFIKSFTMTFLAEWGDRSQLATIGLAASEDVVGVIVGGILGHAICTGAAVLGGKHLATHINERTVAIVGGVVFIIFGLHSLYMGP
uniref:GDT1 family protein n=1 Tax=Polytomella parva TaxID=51329 RepID=A0A7S0YAH0_9CHLO|mmetsp:Transcript_13304/g.23559  ORF Transcript_13304/g.23559 Transcript_13304/m.23559 type:complete len:246 (+) Transcript_13304:101-838(+)|eukprot:CAMPEP_0175082750 /NCGR_PEP_ID=MMETSP0052_2-20121109/26940_1 /TAXON_ID=51329 ORGANISM="Polytomella parva, Strain SAG 63-3" /NCGR_SAMPLE_ID=MMETSP0052_2 /ASSEMBLY_ACC=CAM_ASM_000194 /LENGTH=245 /DNA_ID=CAMNT_0016354003 /DNA_START=23 /DNA_END=760 /DNA_ORIENTATION=+